MGGYFFSDSNEAKVWPKEMSFGRNAFCMSFSSYPSGTAQDTKSFKASYFRPTIEPMPPYSFGHLMMMSIMGPVTSSLNTSVESGLSRRLSNISGS